MSFQPDAFQNLETHGVGGFQVEIAGGVTFVEPLRASGIDVPVLRISGGDEPRLGLHGLDSLMSRSAGEN